MRGMSYNQKYLNIPFLGHGIMLQFSSAHIFWSQDSFTLKIFEHAKNLQVIVIDIYYKRNSIEKV